MSSAKRKLEETSDQQEKKQKIETPTNKSVKILVSGDVEGKFHQLFSTVKTVNDKFGPFQVLFCVGKFFSESMEFSGADSEESERYLKGKSKIPVPTFFVDGGSGNEVLEKIPIGGELAPNLTFLGKYGCFDACGLQVAYLSGIMDPYTYRSASITSIQTYTDSIISRLEDEIKTKAPLDILLTSEWPRDILNNLRDGEYPPKPFDDDDEEGMKQKHEFSFAVTRLLKKAIPRYHFAGLYGAYYERPPYRTITSDGQAHITRFIGLAPVSEINTKQYKWLYAANLVPVSQLTPEQKAKETPDTTPSPFQEVKQKKVYSSIKKGRITGRKPSHIQSRMRSTKNTDENCWFCLSCPDIEKHLLVSIGEESYLALPKGGLVNDHVLIIPMIHCMAYIDLSEKAVEEIEKYKEALRQMFAKLNKHVIIYERNVWANRQHMILDVIPISTNISSNECRKIFEEQGVLHDITYQEYDKNVPIKRVIIESGCENSRYLLIELPDGTRLIHEIKNTKLMLTFARMVCAKLIGAPERVDWKACQVSIRDEEALAEKFQKEFAPFDFTNVE